MLRNIFVRTLYFAVEFVSIITHPLSRLLSRDRVRILCYHRVLELPRTKDSVCQITVSPSSFDEQMAFLYRNGFNVITLDEFINYRHNQKKPEPRTVVITFDDGYADNYVLAFPILKKYGFVATFFMATDFIDADEIFPWLKLSDVMQSHAREKKQYWLPLTRQHILDMANQGATFGSHSQSHCRLTKVDSVQATEEINGSRRHLENTLLRPVKCFCYPYGSFNESIKNLVKSAGYEAAVTVKGGSNSLESDPFELKRTSIGNDDSLTRFKRKVEGAYDWFEYLLQLMGLVKRRLYVRGSRGDA